MKFYARVIMAWIVALPIALPAQDSSSNQNQPLTFRGAIDLAVRNSATTGASQADLQRAQATVSQTKNAYLPLTVVGSGLGASYGFPLSLEGAAPSIFNVNFQGALINYAQKNFIKAAKSDVEVTKAQNAARRNDVIMEPALDYVQLSLLESSLTVQQEQQQNAQKFQDIVAQRVQAGLDSQADNTRAKLAGARTRLDMAQKQAAAE